MACWVYVLRGSDGRLYTGMTSRLEERVKEHNAGRTPADAGRGPFEIVYCECCGDAREARQREKFLKSGVGRAWLTEQLRDNLQSR